MGVFHTGRSKIWLEQVALAGMGTAGSPCGSITMLNNGMDGAGG